MSTELDTEIEALRRDVRPIMAAYGAEHRHDEWCRENGCAYARIERASMSVLAQSRAEALREVPCESEWQRDEEIDCLEAQRRYQRDPDASFPMCLRCQHLAAAEALVAELAKGEQIRPDERDDRVCDDPDWACACRPRRDRRAGRSGGAAMSLTDDIAEAEQQARLDVKRQTAAYVRDRKYGSLEVQAQQGDRLDDALTTYAAICKLAGRWEQHVKDVHYAVAVDDGTVCKTKVAIAAELARLSPKATQEMPEGEA